MAVKVTPESILDFLSNEHISPLSVFEGSLLVSLQKALKCTLHELLLGLADLAQYRAISPLSNFNVGAVAYCSSGNAYIGYNIELEKIILQQVTHAEQCAIVNAWYHGEKQIDLIVTNVIPCGYCRQFMTELPNVKNLGILTSGFEIQPFTKLLPYYFGPEALGLNVEKENLLLPNNYNCVLSEPPKCIPTYIETILEKGIKKSFSPDSYSGCNPSALGIKLRSSDNIMIGSYLESVAFDPSLSPLQAAICIWSLFGPRSALAPLSSLSSSKLSIYTSHTLDFSLIEEVTLLEDPTGKIVQGPIIKQILNIIAPNAKFQSFDIKVPRK